MFVGFIGDECFYPVILGDYVINHDIMEVYSWPIFFFPMLFKGNLFFFSKSQLNKKGKVGVDMGHFDGSCFEKPVWVRKIGTIFFVLSILEVHLAG